MIYSSSTKVPVIYQSVDQPSRKLFTSVEINGATIILSSEDTLTIGEEGVIIDDSEKNVYVFAENINVASNFRAKNAVISTNKLSIEENVIIDVSGKKGKDAIAKPGDANPSQGGSGSDGGSLSLYVENIDPQLAAASYFSINARGGQGGAGQPGGYTKAGGDGGDGGTGGHVRVYGSHLYLSWFNKILHIYKEEDVSKKIEQLNDLLQHFKESEKSLLTRDKELPDMMKALSTLVDSTYSNAQLNDNFNEQLNNNLRSLAETLKLSTNGWELNQQYGIEVRGGDYGVYGEGVPNGKDGSDGTNGVRECKAIDLNDVSNLLNFPYIHPDQCAMIFNKAKLKYMFLDPVKYPEKTDEVIDLFNLLYVRTKPFVNLNNDSNIAKFWHDTEKTIGTFKTTESFKLLHSKVSNYLSFLQQGLDFFGSHPDYVPLVLLKSVQNILDKFLDDVKFLEQEFNAYSNSEAQEDAKKNNIKKIRDTSHTQLTEVNEQISQRKAEIERSAGRIDELEPMVSVKKAAVENTLHQAIEKVKSYFNFDLQDFFYSLACIIPASNVPTASVGWGAKFLQSEITSAGNITDSAGATVNKDFLIHKLTTVTAQFDALIEAYKMNKEGQIELNDIGGNKLLVQEDELNKLFEQFYGILSAEEAEFQKAFNDYKDLVFLRNTQVANYNQSLYGLLQKLHSKTSIEQQQSNLTDQTLDLLNANTPYLKTCAEDAYSTTIENIIEMMGVAAKAYKLWTLDNTDVLTSSLEGIDPSLINSTLLIMINDEIKKKGYFNTINEGSIHSKFDHISYTIKDTDSISTLRDHHQFLLKIEPNNQGESSVFNNLAEIRIAHICAYIHGAKTANNQLYTEITHGGSSLFVKQDNTIVKFQHSPITSAFQYKLDDYQTIVDSDFRIDGSEDNGIKHAILSPLTDWTIKVDPAHNPELNLNGDITIELVLSGEYSGVIS